MSVRSFVGHRFECQCPSCSEDARLRQQHVVDSGVLQGPAASQVSVLEVLDGAAARAARETLHYSVGEDWSDD